MDRGDHRHVVVINAIAIVIALVHVICANGIQVRFICMRVEQPVEVASVLQAACTMVYQAGQAVAVLLSQRLIGAKAF